MKNAYKTAMKAAVVLAIGLWILSKIPFYSNIDQEITANIYENGIVTGETIVFMKVKEVTIFFQKSKITGANFILTVLKEQAVRV